MGGEFIFRHNTDSVVTEQEWQLALQLAIGFLLHKKPWQHSEAPAPTLSTDTEDEYAFKFEDTVRWAGGDPKSFRLRWAWSKEAIESNLGGRQRTDWTAVRELCEFVCIFIPGKFALVVCDGFGGYGEEDMYFDGLKPGWHDLDYQYWPWSRTSNPKAGSAPMNSHSKEQLLQALANNGIRFHGADSLSGIGADVSSLGSDADASSLDDDHAVNTAHVATGGRAEDVGSPDDEFLNHLETGDAVLVVGLKSDAARKLNGCTGQITQVFPETGRFGVELQDGLGSKSINGGNLILTEIVTQDKPDGGELPIDVAVETKASGAPTLNPGIDDGPRVRLLKFSRSPPALGKALLEAPELHAWRNDLQSQALPVELPSGAKVFVRPQHYGPSIEAIRILGIRLHPDHVIADPDIEAVILGVVMELRGRNFVYPKQKCVVPIGATSSATQLGARVCVSRTFIDIQRQVSSSDSAAPCTVSTTDTNDRKGSNPRRKQNRR
mmetsp:Transcript_11563/g.20479  ORF Transcript_11563/g.20479 Transcript_11563/m.20479 type:complete len:494 (-) Transcript_11563:236-1717(-)|eukprot:CAMPEP_0197657506 /NCGR_PEP_ID=MMETSP1338-20131121/44672_1 /TAXON_ID=43686 ORGANISM="Pelagodinium beii, Strain RCC1491" /NCGR_SAMPLE_ID=MMETSP1338 /ASSEMBLY_ACC=CAM_ASM_000754 /LENGTH=493 /DNA_ID=CAMNT_0043233897 /DNA_START=75 /DNA_END=1556 /DNA_ORIENTATION=+